MRRPWVKSERGAIGNGFALLLGGAAAGGLITGAVLGLIGGVDIVGEPAQTGPAATASFFDCPQGESLGSVARGDRVFITGRDDSGEWVQVRSPLAQNTRVWLRAAHVLADASVDDLSVLSCDVPVEAVVAVPTSVVDTTLPVTTTMVVETTTTSSSTTTTSSSTTTTAAMTTTVALPSVGGVSANPASIWESYFGQLTCKSNSSLPSITTVSASVSAAGVQSVTLSWQVDGVSGSAPMARSGGQYVGDLGPFDAENPDAVPQGSSLPIAVTVTVVDGLGRSASSQATVTLNDCTFG